MSSNKYNCAWVRYYVWLLEQGVPDPIRSLKAKYTVTDAQIRDYLTVALKLMRSIDAKANVREEGNAPGSAAV